MARINCEDDFWTDPRREALGLYIGDQEKADGRMLRAWRVSQSYWRKGELVPFAVWDGARLDGILECGLAERQDAGVYCKGSKAHFDWISQNAEAGRLGGIASAAVRKERHGTAVPVNARNRSDTEEGDRSETEAPLRSASKNPPKRPKRHRSATEPSYSYSLLLSSEEIDTPESVPSFDSTMAAKWAAWAPTVSKTVKPDIPKWSDTFRKLRELDGFTESEIEAALEFVKSDDFWGGNAASADGLRSRGKNGLKKFENILNAMKQQNGPQKKSRPLHLNPIAENLEDFDAEHS